MTLYSIICFWFLSLLFLLLAFSLFFGFLPLILGQVYRLKSVCLCYFLFTEPKHVGSFNKYIGK